MFPSLISSLMKTKGPQMSEDKRKTSVMRQNSGDPRCSLLKAASSEDGGGGGGCRYQKNKTKYFRLSLSYFWSSGQVWTRQTYQTLAFLKLLTEAKIEVWIELELAIEHGLIGSWRESLCILGLKMKESRQTLLLLELLAEPINDKCVFVLVT